MMKMMVYMLLQSYFVLILGVVAYFEFVVLICNANVEHRKRLIIHTLSNLHPVIDRFMHVINIKLKLTVRLAIRNKNLSLSIQVLIVFALLILQVVDHGKLHSKSKKRKYVRFLDYLA